MAKATTMISLLVSGLIILALLSGVLYHQSRTYESENRRLIIQNDSIMSVNIELKNTLMGKSSFTGNKITEKTFKAAKRS